MGDHGTRWAKELRRGEKRRDGGRCINEGMGRI